MRIAILSPISWRTPPLHYGPWESVVSLLTEELVHMGLDVTLFATGDSQTHGKLVAVCPRPYSEDRSVDPKVAECLHISECQHGSDRANYSRVDTRKLATRSTLLRIARFEHIHAYRCPQPHFMAHSPSPLRAVGIGGQPSNGRAGRYGP